ncbi:hypothetical protein MHB50_13990 [Siminovitchia sp. FSL H7-0308]|uniref:hypothetical protein n=1 Tax=Siminovitchia sp. FSL H7-0308 TaxID=2921432 RepID=UPI0030EE4F9D
MRMWRVGSFSMGAALLLLGLFLLLTQVFQWDPGYVLLSWWPTLLIILGLEILLYLRIAKKENAAVQYDFISIIFIGLIGTAGVAMVLAHSTGILAVAEQVMKAEVRTENLPKYEETSLAGVKRIVVDSWSYPLNIEGTQEQHVSLFGTYEEEKASETSSPSLKEVSDYALVEKKGDTLFIKMKELPYHRFSEHLTAEATLLVPTGMKLEVDAKNHMIKASPRQIENDWKIEGAGVVEVKAEKSANMNISVQNSHNLGQGDWENVQDKSNERENRGEYGPLSATMTIGNGAHTLTIVGADAVNVH